VRLVKLNNNAVVMVMKEDSEIDGVEIIPNSEDASFEKHVPTYKFLDDESVEISVNHVMEEDHYIEWLLIEYYNEQVIEYFNPGEEAKVVVAYQDGMKAYAYCNKHGLWVNDEINK
jgi:superoxide reductase